ncbi:MAG: HAD family hydrolase [Desulfatiglandales bacterium]
MLAHTIPEILDAVIFDLDGTLIDSIDVHYKVLREIFLRVELSPVSKEDVIYVMRSGLSPWDSLIPADIPNRDEFIQRCKAIDREIWPIIYKREARLFPGSHRTIKFLSQKGIKIGIVTSGFQVINEISQLLHDEGVYSYVGATIMRYDAPRSKPAPDPILLCLKRLAVDPACSVYVGDAPDDIRAGKAAGTKTAAVLSGVGTLESLQSLNPDWIIQGVEEIPNTLLTTEE